MNRAKLKVGIAHVRMAHGGSEARAAWGIQALRDEFNVSLITSGDVDVEAINHFYGTSLQPCDFDLRIAPPPFGLQRAMDAAAMRGGVFQRFCRSIAHEFDVLISAYNFCDFGMPAIQCIADFSWNETIRNEIDPPPAHGSRLICRPSPLRTAYLSLSRVMSRPSGRNLLGDCIIANSQWTAQMMRQRCGVDCQVLYPPVVFNSPIVEWQKREIGFVCLGRISYEKRIEQVIEIISRVRQLGHDLHLHIIGAIDDSPYGMMIQSLCQTNREWIIAEGEKSGSKKEELLSRHRYGIHARPREAFGIAVAEMVKAGCIPFVPDCGGQVEIVQHPELCYRDVEHAVKQIDAVLRDATVQQNLSEHVLSQSSRFSNELFMSEFQQIVERFVCTRRSALAS
jgi:glycosyltransferase involved in cell wall biosynthesis